MERQRGREGGKEREGGKVTNCYQSDGGVVALWRGHLPIILRTVPGQALSFYTIHQFKQCVYLLSPFILSCLFIFIFFYLFSFLS